MSAACSPGDVPTSYSRFRCTREKAGSSAVGINLQDPNTGLEEGEPAPAKKSTSSTFAMLGVELEDVGMEVEAAC